ncbi:MAG: sensor domain-containing diguanylate cyclase [Solirubrobacteraceae bacterium]|nr:sensor domain-containing diguanylate cyclase [Patulibacter sp.]
MVSTESDEQRWAKRHAWIVVLIAAQAVALGVGAMGHRASSWFAIGAVLTIVAPMIVTSLPRFDRTAIAIISSATLLAQTILAIALLGSDLRPNVILLADLCVIALYEIPLLFAFAFASAATLMITLTLADPSMVGIDSSDTTGLLSTLVCGIIATGIGAISLGTLWNEHQRVKHTKEQQDIAIDAYFAVTGSILLVLDRDGTVTRANRRACFLLDRELEQIVGHNWFELAIPGGLKNIAFQQFQQAFEEPPEEYQGGDDQTYENTLVSATGEERLTVWWATLLEDEQGRPTAMVCSGEDVTEHRKAEAEVERGKVELDALRRLAQKVASLDDARQAICDAAIALTGATLVAICEPDRTRERLTYTTATQESLVGFSIHLGREASLVGTAFLGSQPQFMADLHNTPGLHRNLTQLATDGNAGSALHQPIIGANGTLGVISVAWDRPIASLGERPAELIGLIATEAAIALRRRESLAQLERAALVDPLTGIANRRAFDAELPLALRRAAEGNYPLSLIVMDLNEFKAVNDILGHEAGDDVLIQAAGAWADALRAGDLLARIGGDEFTVVLPTCDQIEMDHIIARLRAVTPHGPGTSLGGAVWDGIETVASLIRRADASQYEDKARSKETVRRTPSGQQLKVPERRRARHTDPRADAPASPPAAADDDA